jgi:hypothetical protein
VNAVIGGIAGHYTVLEVHYRRWTIYIIIIRESSAYTTVIFRYGYVITPHNSPVANTSTCADASVSTYSAVGQCSRSSGHSVYAATPTCVVAAYTAPINCKRTRVPDATTLSITFGYTVFAYSAVGQRQSTSIIYATTTFGGGIAVDRAPVRNKCAIIEYASCALTSVVVVPDGAVIEIERVHRLYEDAANTILVAVLDGKA